MPRSFMKLKACPRCRGDILVDNAFEESEVCLQCGFRGGGIPAYLADVTDWKERKSKYALKELDKFLLKSQ